MKKLLLALAMMLFATPALAVNCAAYPYTLTNGTTADANQVMGDFNSILSCANASLAHNAANSDITSLSGLTTALTVAQGGTGAATAAAARTSLGLGAAATQTYVEGTWTPALALGTPGTSAFTYTTQIGTYTRVGNLVTVQFRIDVSIFTVGTGSGNLTITGLPVTAAANDIEAGALTILEGVTYPAGRTTITVAVEGLTLVLVANGSAASAADIAAGNLAPANLAIRGSITYRV